MRKPNLDLHTERVNKFHELMKEKGLTVKEAAKNLKTPVNSYYASRMILSKASAVPATKKTKDQSPIVITQPESQVCIILGNTDAIKDIFTQMGRMS